MLMCKKSVVVFLHLVLWRNGWERRKITKTLMQGIGLLQVYKENPLSPTNSFEKTEYKSLMRKQASPDVAKTKMFVPS
jgi:hypothetical protein